MSLVSEVFDISPQIAAFSACSNVQVAKPTTSFAMLPQSQYCVWGTPVPRHSCSLISTVGPEMAKLYGFDTQTTSWSPNCWNLQCPSQACAGRR